MAVALICQNCGKEYRRKPYLAAKSKACSKKCLGIIQRTESKGKVFAPNSPILWKSGPENPVWKGGGENYAKRFQRNACERCGSSRFLLVHHKDEDKYHNEPSNLETLCKKCHQNHHLVRDPETGRFAGKIAR